MPAWEDPTGIYRVTFRGLSGEITAEVNIYRPVRPLVVMFGNRRMLLYHFSPNERVRLFIYGECRDPEIYGVCIVGWQEYQVDSQGNLSLDLGKDLDQHKLAILGEKSGEVLDLISDFSEGSIDPVKRKAGESLILRSSCPGAPPQRFRVNRYGEVCTKFDRVKVRQEPRRSAREITRLEPGTSF